jgi:hypothetical protein
LLLLSTQPGAGRALVFFWPVAAVPRGQEVLTLLDLALRLERQNRL